MTISKRSTFHESPFNSMTEPDLAEFLLCVQHGWADDNRAMLALARQLAPEAAVIVAPNLGYLQTWIRIAPLIQTVEAAAAIQMADYPELPLRIVGHSMGGLIWLEVLNRHPHWWPRVHSLVLIASPVGGADLGRIIDPFQVGLGIAADLGVNRKPLAETIAAAIPTLVIAGDLDGGSDGTVPVACTKFAHAQFVCLPGLSHPELRHHPSLVPLIQTFWSGATVGESVMSHAVIERLRQVPGITDGHLRDFKRAHVMMNLSDGGTLRTWKNPVGVHHVFVASPEGECLYAGFVGWIHTIDLQRALQDIQQMQAYP